MNSFGMIFGGISRRNQNFFLGKLSGNARCIHSLSRHFKYPLYDCRRFRIDHECLLISRQPGISIRHRPTASKSFSHSRLENGTNLPARIFGVPFVDYVQKRGKLVLCRIVAVHIAVDCDKSDALLWKMNLSVKTNFQIVSSKTAHIFDDHRSDQSSINVTQHLMEAWAIEVGACVSVIRIMLDVGKAVLSGIVLQIFLLVLNGVALSGCLVIPRKPLIQSCNACFSFALNQDFTSFPCAAESCHRFYKIPVH